VTGAAVGTSLLTAIAASLAVARLPGFRTRVREIRCINIVFAGDADASGTVDALLPLWFALVKHAGGNRRVALSIVR